MSAAPGCGEAVEDCRPVTRTVCSSPRSVCRALTLSECRAGARRGWRRDCRTVFRSVCSSGATAEETRHTCSTGSSLQCSAAPSQATAGSIVLYHQPHIGIVTFTTTWKAYDKLSDRYDGNLKQLRQR